MAISIDTLRRGGDPAHVVIAYGGEGLGKTTLFSSLPEPVMLQTERGKGNNEVPSWRINTFADLMQGFEVAVESGQFKTIILDSLDHAEPLVWAETCRRNGWSNVEEPGFGKGFIAVDQVWLDLWKYIEGAAYDADMVVAITAHSQTRTFQDPEGPSYDRHEMKLHKRANAFFKEKADMILFLNNDTATSELNEGSQKRTVGRGGQTRSLYSEKRAAFDAKNRHQLPFKVAFPDPKDHGPFDWSVYAAAFPAEYFN